MTAFRILLVSLFLAIATYTALVIASDGVDLITPFFGDLASLGWRGQFNLDFSSYLTLSAVWIAWRNDFSLGALAFAGAAGVLGMVVLAPYLLALTYTTGGDSRAILLGPRRATDTRS